MSRNGAAGPSTERLNAILAFVVFVLVVVVSYRSERAFRRWSAKHHPFAAQKTQITRMKKGYRQSRATATEIAQLAGGLMDELGDLRS